VPHDSEQPEQLRRVLTLGPLVLYGLGRIKRREPGDGRGFTAPAWIPPAAIAASLALLAAELLS
jgi:hypothetical protein